MLSVLVYSACEVKKSNVIEKKTSARLTPLERFSVEETRLHQIANEFRAIAWTNSKHNLVIFSPSDFSPAIENELKTVGITSVLFYQVGCDSEPGGKEFDFTVNWTGPAPVHLVQSPCEEQEFKKGAHSEHENGNEGWGMGDKWMVWYEYSPVNSDSFPPHYKGPRIGLERR